MLPVGAALVEIRLLHAPLGGTALSEATLASAVVDLSALRSAIAAGGGEGGGGDRGGGTGGGGEGGSGEGEGLRLRRGAAGEGEGEGAFVGADNGGDAGGARLISKHIPEGGAEGFAAESIPEGETEGYAPRRVNPSHMVTEYEVPLSDSCGAVAATLLLSVTPLELTLVDRPTRTPLSHSAPGKSSINSSKLSKSG